MILTSFFMAAGIAFVFIIGFYLDWRMTAFIIMIPPIIMTLTISFFPETPYWLVENNDCDGAKKSLIFFRGKNYSNVTAELDEIKGKYQSKLQDAKSLSHKTQIRRLFSMAFLKPYSCVGILFSLTTWTGFDILQTYMIPILEEYGSSIGVNFSTVPIIVGILGLITAGMVIQELL